MTLGFSVLDLAPLVEPTPTKNSMKITRKEFNNWKQQFTWDALCGSSYGQSFCKYFIINDYILEFSRDPTFCDEYIQRTYVREAIPF